MRLSIIVLLSIVTILIFSLGVVSVAEKQIPGSFMSGKELSSPNDWIKEEEIKVFNNRVTIYVNDPTWASFTNTNSMDPFIDETSNAIQISPKIPEMIKIGDVISYRSSYGTIIHRVIEVNEDKEGVYFKVKGDNNAYPDSQKVRFDEIIGVVIAVVY